MRKYMAYKMHLSRGDFVNKEEIHAEKELLCQNLLYLCY